MCKKCNTYLALQGSDHCASCVPPATNVTQSQTGPRAQQQVQHIQATGIKVDQQQSQASGGSQQQSFMKGGDKDSKSEKS